MKTTRLASTALSLSAITLIAGSAFAENTNSLSGWKEISSTSERVYTSGEFVKLQQKYPRYFASVDAAQVTNGYIIFHAHHYMGTSVCPAGDSRLDRSTTETGYCTLNSGCSVSSEALIGEDPCRL